MITYQNFGKPFAGNLGNNLFQIASLYGLAKRYGTTLTLPPGWKYSEYFPNLSSVIKFSTVTPLTRIEEPHFHCTLEYFDGFRDLISQNIVDLKGWLQSEKYWNSNKNEIYQILAFAPELVQRIVQENKTHKRKNFVAISVRRGDYVGNPNYELLPIYYYLGALETFFPNHSVMVFSDDMEWCKNNFKVKNVFFADTYDPIEQLCLMSTFTKFILANSTFSWWGAYLAKSKALVVRPNYHFGKKWDGKLSWADYYPEDWVVFDHKATSRVKKVLVESI